MTFFPLNVPYSWFSERDRGILSKYNEDGGVAEVAINAEKLEDPYDAIWSLARGLLIADLLKVAVFLLVGIMSYVIYNFGCSVFSVNPSYSMWAVLIGYIVYGVYTHCGRFTNQNPTVWESISTQYERIQLCFGTTAILFLIDTFMPIRIAITFSIQ